MFSLAVAVAVAVMTVMATGPLCPLLRMEAAGSRPRQLGPGPFSGRASFRVSPRERP